MHGRQLDEATLRFLSGEDSSVSSEVLAQALRGLQTAVWLLGAQALEHSVNERFKPGQELRQHYELVCRAPESGSYAMPVELWDIRQQSDLTSPTNLLGRALEVVRAVSEGDREVLRERMPDSFLRNRMLRELARFLPRPGDTWKLDVERSGASVTLDARSGRTAESWLRVPEETATMTVTGDLVRVDFEENKVVIRHPVTNRTIDCYARADVIDDLVENHYEPVQVTGVFTLDENDHPIKLTDVSVVETVDLSPLT
ncbi:MAG: hypothetical protein Q8K99_12650, partial [Actinomycetota bacterium]|nr:hypothetical protein [Actinomycetota bacterium]